MCWIPVISSFRNNNEIETWVSTWKDVQVIDKKIKLHDTMWAWLHLSMLEEYKETYKISHRSLSDTCRALGNKISWVWFLNSSPESTTLLNPFKLQVLNDQGVISPIFSSICLPCRRPQFHSWVRKIPWRRDRLPTPGFLGFPCGSAGKESACNVGDVGAVSPWVGKIPGEGKGYPLQYSGLENSMDFIVHGVAKSRTWMGNFHFHFSFSVLVCCECKSVFP